MRKLEQLRDSPSQRGNRHHKHNFLFLFLAHSCPFSTFHRTVTHHAINSFVHRRGYVSTSGYFCPGGDGWGGGGGSDAFVQVFVKGHALIQSGKWKGHEFFSQKISKIPRPTPPPQTDPIEVHQSQPATSVTFRPSLRHAGGL